MVSGEVLKSESEHFYIQHKTLTYDIEALKKFGTRLDYKEGVKIVLPYQASMLIQSIIQEFTDNAQKPHLGGKNVGAFDLQFLLNLDSSLGKMIKHRFVDIGNLFHRPGDEELPDLDTCLKRGQENGIPISCEVTHTALDDAMVCAELYAGWYNLNKNSL